jgi:hypothetical protein
MRWGPQPRSPLVPHSLELLTRSPRHRATLQSGGHERSPSVLAGVDGSGCGVEMAISQRQTMVPSPIDAEFPESGFEAGYSTTVA